MPSLLRVLEWSKLESESQILNSFKVFGYDVSAYSKRDLANYKPNYRKTVFHSHETGFDSGTKFYIKTENKAGGSLVRTLGPMVLDDTPTRYTEIVGNHVTSAGLITHSLILKKYISSSQLHIVQVSLRLNLHLLNSDVGVFFITIVAHGLKLSCNAVVNLF